jgi:large subunit ribosomal protein L6
MSRIGQQPIAIPAGVSVDLKGSSQVAVKGPKGELSMELRPEVSVAVNDGVATVQVTGTGSENRSRAFHGLTRALLANMVTGVSTGFVKKLEIQGVGWNAKVQGQKLVLNIGFCHPVEIEMPEGVSVECESNTAIQVSGADKQAVGQMAATIRKTRPPEPYKGKGIRYVGEYVRRKAGKSFGT